jgi:hypothetical protein
VWKSRDDKGKDTGRIQEGRRQVGGRSEGSRRQVGGISLKWALEGDAKSKIQERRFTNFGIQIVFKEGDHIKQSLKLSSNFCSAKIKKKS